MRVGVMVLAEGVRGWMLCRQAYARAQAARAWSFSCL